MIAPIPKFIPTESNQPFWFFTLCYYISRQLFQIFTQSLMQLMFVYTCRSKSLKQYQCNWSHKMLFDADWKLNVQIFQCSNAPMFQCSKVITFKCSNIPIFQCSHTPMFKCSNVQMFKCSKVQMLNV